MVEFLFTIAIMALCFCFGVTLVALVSGITFAGLRKLAGAVK